MSEAPNLSMKLLGVDRFKEFPTLTAGQSSLLDQFVNLLSGEVGKGIEPYPGEMIPGEDPLQTKAFEAFGAPSDRYSSMIESAISRAVSGEPAYKSSPEDIAAYFDLLEAPARANFERVGLRGIQEQFAGRGQEIGGGLIDASLGATGEFEQGLLAQRAAFARGDLDAERASREAAYGRLLPGAELAGVEQFRVPSVLAGAGAERRGIATELASEGVWDWLTSQPYANPWLGFAPLALGTQTKGVTSR
jgi:hypothetical protein